MVTAWCFIPIFGLVFLFGGLFLFSDDYFRIKDLFAFPWGFSMYVVFSCKEKYVFHLIITSNFVFVTSRYWLDLELSLSVVYYIIGSFIGLCRCIIRRVSYPFRGSYHANCNIMWQVPPESNVAKLLTYPNFRFPMLFGWSWQTTKFSKSRRQKANMEWWIKEFGSNL